MLTFNPERSYQPDVSSPTSPLSVTSPKYSSHLANNMLIFGDNLLALQALADAYYGQVKLIYIDPPYNTKKIFKHYSDRLTSQAWLDMMEERVRCLKELLSPDGSLWIQIDDTEAHYLKILCDQIFGRTNFMGSVIWQRKTAPVGKARRLSRNHDHILVYAKKADKWHITPLPRTDLQKMRYKNPTEDPRGPYSHKGFISSFPKKTLTCRYPIEHPLKGQMLPPPEREWCMSKKRYEEMLETGHIVFTPTGIQRKHYLAEVKEGVGPVTVWLSSDTGSTLQAKAEVLSLNADSVFATPKPERLLHRIVHLASVPGDLVLDCFAGSGTTGAVAHKMGRRWIMIENGEQMHTHIIPRLKKVIDGEDKKGITKAVGWKGGGGFQYYEVESPPQSVLQNASNSSMLCGATQGQPKAI